MTSEQIRIPAARASPSIPDYELLRPVGRGAYGEVWLARNLTGSFVALKIVHRAAFDHDRPLEREFEGIRRFEPVSRSDPSQVAILHVGRGERFFYYVMELADDVAVEVTRLTSNSEIRVSKSEAEQSLLKSTATYQPKTLKRLLHDRGALPAADCVQITLSLTRALAHLHGHGLVHRDVKPSNVIFVNGVAKLADIGLVTSVDATRSFVGTEGYLPPEGAGTPQSDLYSLGKVLYEMSTGCDREEFPALPPDIATRPDRDALAELNAIVVKACQLDPRQRYQSAKEMHADLSLLEVGQSVGQKRSRERYGHILKKICMTTAVLGLTAAALIALLNVIWPDAPNPSDRRSKVPLANKEYEEGMYCLRRDNKEGLEQARSHFNHAVEFDRSFTMAYNGLFEVYIGGKRLGLPEAEVSTGLRAYASKLMQLDSALAEAHAAQAWLDFLDWKWDKGERRFIQAIRLNPKCAIAHMRYGFCLVYSGRPDEGHKELLAAELLDPTLPRIKKNLGHVFYIKRQYREAIVQYQKAIDLEPSYPYAHDCLGTAYIALGDYTRALDEFEKCEVLLGRDPVEVRGRFNAQRRAYEQGGSRGYWFSCLEEAKRANNFHGQARSYAKLGDYDQALTFLEKAFATNELQSLETLWGSECWDSVHNNPRFIALLKKTGLKK